MAWLAPGAFAALILVAGPVIVHMLARRAARRLVFPATHLVREMQAAAVRLRRPSDIGLLLLRLAIVAAAVLAAARPLVMTPWRLARWNARVARAVVVDTSRSIPDPGVAARLADEQMRNVFAARRVNTPDLADGIDRAVRWLRAAPPSRREIVLVSDFQRGSLDEAALEAIPAEIGVRVIRAGVQPGTRRVTLPAVDGWRGGVWQATATIDAAGTRVSWVRGGSTGAPGWITLMTSAADAVAGDWALRAAASQGVSGGDTARRVIVRFAGAPPLVPVPRPVTSPWIVSAALTDALRGVEPAVTVSEHEGVMVVDAPIAASAFEAPAIVRAALLAVRPAAIADAEAEVATLPDDELLRWRRDSAPVTTPVLPVADGGGESDARWLWALALALLAIETGLRQIRVGAPAESLAKAGRSMPTPHDRSGAADLVSVLDRTRVRIRIRHALRACEAGLFGAAAAIVLGDLVRISALKAALAGVAAGAVCAAARYLWIRADRTALAAARAIESSDPDLRNLVVTAQELIAFPDRTPPYMRDRVLAEAARRAGAVDPGRISPLGRDVAAAVVGVAVLASVVAVRATTAALPGPKPSPAATRPAVLTATEFTIDVAAPPYTGRPPLHFRNPASLEALAGSQAVIHVPGTAASVVRLNGTALLVDAEGVARTVLNESGYLAIDAAAVHALLPLSVTPDRAPDVRVTAPAKDLRVATTAVTIPIVAEAADDLALRLLELRYTIVSGTGEQFSFTEGTLPATLARGSDRSWRIEATLSPAQMKLEAGDALIYRAVAGDRRPGDAGLASSDTFFVEIAGPGDVALAGVEMPPDKERYALSQAMIVLKIERLMAREKGTARPALEEEAGNIGAEQRAVRANFIFLLGGEIEDEDVEAETSSEIAEGRFANKARQEIVAATVLMGRVERALTAVSTREALGFARDAVRALQRAFGHSRYLLRALPARARIDPARRLSGDLTSAADWNRALAPPAPDPQTEAARSALIELIAVMRSLDDEAARPAVVARLSRLAERLLAMAGRAGDLQPAARDLVAARDALAASHVPSARAALQQAAAPLVTRAQRGRIDGRTVPRDASRLAGAAAVGATHGGGAAPSDRRPPGGGSR